MWTALHLTVGLAAMAAYKVEARMGAGPTVLALTILIPAGYLALGFMDTYPALIIMFLFYIIRGIATPVLKDYIHRLSRSEVRATVLSVRNFIIRFCFVLVGPAMGWLTDNEGLKTALLFGGSTFLLLGLAFAWFFNKYNTRSELQA